MNFIKWVIEELKVRKLSKEYGMPISDVRQMISFKQGANTEDIVEVEEYFIVAKSKPSPIFSYIIENHVFGKSPKDAVDIFINNEKGFYGLHGINCYKSKNDYKEGKIPLLVYRTGKETYKLNVKD